MAPSGKRAEIEGGEMLTPAQLKPHVLHEDRWIRRAVLESFKGSWSRDPDVAGLALTAHERYFKLGEFPDLDGLRQLVFDVPTARRALSLLDATPSRVVVTHLNWCLASLPLDVFGNLGNLLEDHPRLDEETRKKIRYRRKLGDLTVQALWAEFLEFSGRAAMRRVPPRVDLLRADALIDELARRKTPDKEKICSWLRSPTFSGTYFEALLMKLAGVRRLKAAAPILVSKLVEDDEDEEELRPSFLGESLIRIGASETIGLIRLRFPDLRQKDAAVILGSHPAPESEEALLGFFEEADDPDLRFFIAESLCRLFSARSVGPVRMVVEDGICDDEMVEELKEKALAVIDLLGIEVPEAEDWRKERQERFARERSPEVVNPQALEIHRKILGTLEEMEEEERNIPDPFQYLARRIAESKVEKETMEEEEEGQD
jgi:hypothetical protein